MKKCRSCGVEKENTQFYKRFCNSDGLYSYCIECTLRKNKNVSGEIKDRRRKKSREYQQKNRDHIRERSKNYYQENRESVLKRVGEYREKNKEIISLREAVRRINDQNRFEKNRKKHFEWSKDHREQINANQREWYQKNKKKRWCHVVLNRAVKSGKIVRPKNCSECKKECKPDGHHQDYSKPLEVIWICKVCHARKSPRTVIK